MAVGMLVSSGGVGRFGSGPHASVRECLVARPAKGGRSANLALMGRALAVCSAVGIAVAGLAANGVHFEAFRLASAATPEFAVAPIKAGLKLTSAAPTFTEETAVAGGKGARVDRVPYEFLLPEGFGDPDEILEFGPRRIRRHLVETIMKAARATDADPVLLMAIADKESSFSTAVKARTSSATGLFQFIEATWLRVVRDFGAKHGLEKEAAAINWVDDELTISDAAERARILELRRDPYVSALLAAEMLKRDRSRIAGRIGRDLTEGETYLAHFLGPDDAERFMEKVVGQPGAPAAKLLPKPARANRPIFFARRGRKAKSLSVAEVHDRFESMMEARLDRFRNVHKVAGALAYADASAQ